MFLLLTVRRYWGLLSKQSLDVGRTERSDLRRMRMHHQPPHLRIPTNLRTIDHAQLPTRVA
jgi:hypothetical protein